MSWRAGHRSGRRDVLRTRSASWDRFSTASSASTRTSARAGFSVVYRGTHVGLDEPIAIKCLKLPAALGSALVESFVRRFRDESRLHYKLSQGNLAHRPEHRQRHDDRAGDERARPVHGPRVARGPLAGATSSTSGATRACSGRPLREVVALLDSAVDALAYAHAQGVVHRDLNPGNLFLGAHARRASSSRSSTSASAKVMADSAIAHGPDGADGRQRPDVRAGVRRARAVRRSRRRDRPVDRRLRDRARRPRGAHRPHRDRRRAPRRVRDEGARRRAPPHSARARASPWATRRRRSSLQALALDPSRRPRDAGELWGMLKHAMQVDARSGRLPHAELATIDAPSTLRMRGGRARPWQARGARCASGSVDAAPTTSGRPSARDALGGTLRMDHARPSASDGSPPRRTSVGAARAGAGLGAAAHLGAARLAVGEPRAPATRCPLRPGAPRGAGAVAAARRSPMRVASRRRSTSRLRRRRSASPAAAPRSSSSRRSCWRWPGPRASAGA